MKRTERVEPRSVASSTPVTVMAAMRWKTSGIADRAGPRCAAVAERMISMKYWCDILCHTPVVSSTIGTTYTPDPIAVAYSVRSRTFSLCLILLCRLCRVIGCEMVMSRRYSPLAEHSDRISGRDVAANPNVHGSTSGDLYVARRTDAIYRTSLSCRRLTCAVEMCVPFVQVNK